MLDAIEGALYYDEVVHEHCECIDLKTTADGPVVVLYYLASQATVTVDLDVFRDSENIAVEHLPEERSNSQKY